MQGRSWIHQRPRRSPHPSNHTRDWELSSMKGTWLRLRTHAARWRVAVPGLRTGRDTPSSLWERRWWRRSVRGQARATQSALVSHRANNAPRLRPGNGLKKRGLRTRPWRISQAPENSPGRGILSAACPRLLRHRQPRRLDRRRCARIRPREDQLVTKPGHPRIAAGAIR